MNKKAIITSITEQDGSYLVEFLLEKRYEVHGIIRRARTFNTECIDHLYIDPHNTRTNMFLHYGNLYAISEKFNTCCFHVIPTLINKCFDAIENSKDDILE